MRALTTPGTTARIAAMALLTRLLRDRPDVIDVGDDIAAWWRRFVEAEADRVGSTPGVTAPRVATAEGNRISAFDRAVTAGFRANRLAGAFAGGYQGALRALVGRLPDDIIASFCVSEPGGNSPRAIEARLTPLAAGGYTLNGRKRWSTMAPVASLLLVAAHDGVDAAGRKRFKLVRVSATAPGVTIARMPPTPFIPEIPHAELELHDVAVGADAPLPGDGYTEYVKRFRTVEDIYIHGAVLGYVLGAGRRFGFPDTVLERTVSAILAVRVLADLDPDAAETHVALAGALARDANLLDHSDAHWEKAEPDERDRWRRDRKGLGSVAGELREARRRRAWERLEIGNRGASRVPRDAELGGDGGSCRPPM